MGQLGFECVKLSDVFVIYSRDKNVSFIFILSDI